MLETRLLKYFLAVAREQNITRAAESLHVSQSTLSKQLIDLENELGVKLLIRGKRIVTLTEEGRYLRSRAQEAVDFLNQTENELLKEEGVISGDIRLGCAQMASMRPITKAMGNFQMKYPDVQFHLISGDAEHIMEKLAVGTLDIGIILDPPVEKQFEYNKLPFQETFGILMRSDNPLCTRESISFSELKNVPLLMPDQAHTGAAHIEWFHDSYESYRIIATYDLIGNALYWAEEGFGVIFCLKNLVDTQGTDLVFRPVASSISAHVTILTKKYQIFSKQVKLFMDILKETTAL